MSYKSIPREIQAYEIGSYLPTNTIRELSENDPTFQQEYLRRISEDPMVNLKDAILTDDIYSFSLISDNYQLAPLEDPDVLDNIIRVGNVDMLSELAKRFDLDLVLDPFFPDSDSSNNDYIHSWMVYRLALQDDNVMEYLLESDIFPGAGYVEGEDPYGLLVGFINKVLEKFALIPQGFYNGVWKYLTRRDDSLDIYAIRSHKMKELLQYLLDIEEFVE